MRLLNVAENNRTCLRHSDAPPYNTYLSGIVLCLNEELRKVGHTSFRHVAAP
jgi:hypothetical protein